MIKKDDEDEYLPILSKRFEEKQKNAAKQFNLLEQLDYSSSNNYVDDIN